MPSTRSSVTTGGPPDPARPKSPAIDGQGVRTPVLGKRKASPDGIVPSSVVDYPAQTAASSGRTTLPAASLSQSQPQPLRMSPNPQSQRPAQHTPSSLAGFPQFASSQPRSRQPNMPSIDAMMVDHPSTSDSGGAFNMLGMPPSASHSQPFTMSGPPQYASQHQPPTVNGSSSFYGSPHHSLNSPMMPPPPPQASTSNSSGGLRSVPLAPHGSPTFVAATSTSAGPNGKAPSQNGASGGRDSQSSNSSTTTGNANGADKMQVKSEDGKDSKDGADAPRTGRACLACRKLKTRCDGAEDPPCRRCRQGGHECIFVESKRGKRPAKKHASGDLVEKFKQVEQALNMVIQSINSGQPPDAATVNQLQQMKQTLAMDPSVHGGAASSVDGASTAAPTPILSSSRFPPQSPGSVTSSNGTLPQNGEAPHHAIRRNTVFASHPASLSSKKEGESQRRASSHIGVSAGAGLTLLADASLAAQLDGSSGITGLDPTFNLSAVTEALEQPVPPESPSSLSSPSDKRSPGGVSGNGGESGSNHPSHSQQANGPTSGDEEGPRPAPALLTKGIVDADTAVELFRVFFDYCYIHLPLLDPAENSATAVCARSPFLFTVICAIASRFHPNRDLDPACYDEAHACFMQTIVSGERSIESVQACMLLTVWTAAPKAAVDDRPQQAWLYHGMAVRMAMELGLFRPPAFSDLIPMRNGRPQGGFPWSALKDVPQDRQRDALNRERTWLLLFIIDRYMAAVTGRPYQVHDAKPFLIPTHPLSLPFDLGIIAHQELQSVVTQVMDTFRDRIYGFAAASNEMPSPVVMKLFNGRMDEWRARWCPKSGEPISNNLLFYWYNSKLFLNTFPLQTMLRNGEAADDPECVSTCINSAKQIFDLVHKYAELGVLRHCPDFNILVLLYAAVFLLKVRVSESRFSQLISGEELVRLMRQAIDDCSSAMISERHATGTVSRMFRALLATYHKMNSGSGSALGVSRGPSQTSHPADQSRRESAVDFSAYMHSVQNSPRAPLHAPAPTTSTATGASTNTATPSIGGGGGEGPFASTSADGPAVSMSGIQPSSPAHPDLLGPGGDQSGGFRLGALPSSQGMFSGINTPGPFYGPGSSRPHTPGNPLESFLSDTHFYDSMLVSQGSDGFFAWQDGLDSAAGMLDLDTFGSLLPPSSSQPSQTQSNPAAPSTL